MTGKPDVQGGQMEMSAWPTSTHDCNVALSVFGIVSTRMNPIILFRPVGEAELVLIRQSGWREFPPRLPEQPIFYPVLDEHSPKQSPPRLARCKQGQRHGQAIPSMRG
jgi:hypothetical protein